MMRCLLLVLFIRDTHARFHKSYPHHRFQNVSTTEIPLGTARRGGPPQPYTLLIGQASAYDYNEYNYDFSDISSATKGCSTYLTGSKDIYKAQKLQELDQAFAQQGCTQPDGSVVPFCGSIALETDDGVWQGNDQPGGTISSMVPAQTDIFVDPFSCDTFLITMGIRDWSPTQPAQSLLPQLTNLHTGDGFFYAQFAAYLNDWKTKYPNRKYLVRFGYELCAVYADATCGGYDFTGKVYDVSTMQLYVEQFVKFQETLDNVTNGTAHLVLNPLGNGNNTNAFLDEFQKIRPTFKLSIFGVDMVLNSTEDSRSEIPKVFHLAKAKYPDVHLMIPESSVNVHAPNSLQLMQYLQGVVLDNNLTYWVFINRNGLGGGADWDSRLQDNATLKAWWISQYLSPKECAANFSSCVTNCVENATSCHPSSALR
eukprot:7233305-Prymnesium_polylepis.1